MEQLLICVTLAVLGLCMGSFAGATVWRLRARQLVEDKAAGEKVDSKELKKLLPLTKTTLTSDRSRCLHCEHTLAWYDLLPLASWLSTGGKCRYCHKKIGWFEPAMELGVAALFVSLYLLWPLGMSSIYEITQFVLWLIAGVLLAILFAYDLKWYLLPNYIVFPLIGIGTLFAVLAVIGTSDMTTTLLNILFSGIILSGIYFILWLISKGQWIGFGDVKLGLGLALLLADWKLAFIALFAANLIGCLIVIPGMVAKKIDRKTRVPFGPLLIAGTVLAMLVGRYIIDWYFISFI
ncbi:MAG: putative Prepilin peptidase [Candidatus Saccharibacteria bacterium]|nr:putative Prepilin peptidase [Candidatus Saccharibacteria bacterium]